MDQGLKMKTEQPQLIIETTTASSFSHPWHLLPDDILPTIFKNLCIGDRVRSRLVCKSWKEILTQYNIPEKPEAPWQILSNDSYNKPEACLQEIQLRSLSEQRIYRFRFGNQSSAGGWWCCGSSRGWLLITDLNADMFLWQPLSGNTRQLPPLSTLPFFDEYIELEYVELDTSGRIEYLSSVVHRVEVFSMDSDECIVAVIFKRNTSDEIALCTQHEKTWKILGGGEFEPCYSDILYHSANRKLVALATNVSRGDAQGLLSNNEILLTDCRIPVSIIIMPISITSITQDEFPFGLELAHRQSMNFHLVESTLPKKIIIVYHLLDCVASEKAVNNEPIVRFRCQQTTDFSVHALDYTQSYTEVLSSIGAETIFLGAAGSFSTPAMEGIEANCIYFATDDAEGLAADDKQYVVREHGVFSLQHDKLQQASSRTIRLLSGSKVGWFMPRL